MKFFIELYRFKLTWFLTALFLAFMSLIVTNVVGAMWAVGQFQKGMVQSQKDMSRSIKQMRDYHMK